MSNPLASLVLNGNVALNLTWVGLTPDATDVLTILRRDDPGAFGTLFFGTTEGGLVNFTNGYTGVISYLGGTDSNDVTITNIAAVPEPEVWILAVLGSIVAGWFAIVRSAKLSAAKSPRFLT